MRRRLSRVRASTPTGTDALTAAVSPSYRPSSLGGERGGRRGDVAARSPAQLVDRAASDKPQHERTQRELGGSRPDHADQGAHCAGHRERTVDGPLLAAEADRRDLARSRRLGWLAVGMAVHPSSDTNRCLKMLLRLLADP